MGREENIKIFQDTERLCRENPVLKDAVARSIKRQQVIVEADGLVDQRRVIYLDPAKIVVSQKRSFEAASVYPLNFSTIEQ